MTELGKGEGHRVAAASRTLWPAGLALALVSGGVEAQLEEVVVTAQKREESLQDVPIAVNAIDAGTLEKAGIVDIRQLTALAPSLVLSSSASEAAGTVARIRGIGTTGDNPGLESSVAVFIDGVYRNRNNNALTDLGEIERIEVLRGPQGTLFGKNASAGLINIITKGPSYEPEAHLSGSFGSFNELRLNAGWSGPLVDDRIAFRIDGAFNERDGFLEDRATGQSFNDRDRVLFRAQLRADPSEAVSMRIIADYADRNETCCAATTIVAGPTTGFISALGGDVVVPPDPFERDATVNVERGYQQDVEDYGVSLQIDADASFGTFTSITSYREWNANRSQDLDYTSADVLFRDIDGNVQGFDTFTQELRLAGTSDRIDWMVGGFYSDEELSLDDAIRTGAVYEPFLDLLLGGGVPGTLPAITGLAPGTIYSEGQGVVRDSFHQEAVSWALFTHNTLRFSDRVSLGFGVRYTEEDKDLEASLLSDNPACLASVGLGVGPPDAIGLVCLPFFNPLTDGEYASDRTDKEFTGTVNLNVEFSDSVSGYASYGVGYKAGGFNLDRAGLGNPLLGLAPSGADLEFEAETVDSYEIGIKSRLAGGAMQLNLAAFSSEFEDFQLNTFTGINFVVSNLAEVTTEGFELDFTALPFDPLIIRGGVAFANARYGDDIIDPATGVLSPLAGQTLTNAPRWSASLAATYEQPLGNGLLGFLHLDSRFTSEMNTGSDLDVEKIQDAFTVLNMRVGLGSDSERWTVEVWARNLLDEDFIQIAFDQPLQGSGSGPGSTQTFGAFLGEPRMVGATLRLRF